MENLLTTAEMVIEAITTGETYYTKGVRYSTKLGFHDSFGDAYASRSFKTIDAIMGLTWMKMVSYDTMIYAFNSAMQSLGFNAQFKDIEELDAFACRGPGNDLVMKNIIHMSDSTAIGKVSDGYHTFDELYHHRAMLFASVCMLLESHGADMWKSELHHDGTRYDGMFIVGLNTELFGQASYHYDMKYWHKFDVPVLEYAPEWDGHTPTDAIERIYQYARSLANKGE